MNAEICKEIASTINNHYENEPLYYVDGTATGGFIQRETRDERKNKSILGSDMVKLLFMEHEVIPVKTLYMQDEDVVRIWFEELDTLKENEHVYSIEF